MNPTPETPTSWMADPNITRLCSEDGTGQFMCPSDRTCGHPLTFEISLSDDGVP
jgi:hypothetical protein